MSRKSVTDILKLKSSNTKISVLTCYTHAYAQILDEYCDILLVGDSLGMVLYGYESTLPVKLSTMIEHGAAVVRGSKNAMVVVDMPFGSYQEEEEVAFRNAAKIIKKTGAGAVKLEGGEEMAETIEFLTKRGVPVMGHVGLKPQYVNALGGYKVQGKTSDEEKQILADAKAVEKAGAFAIVVEGVTKKLADKIVAALKIPVIGIGASGNCAGQVLVTEDMLGLFEHNAKFVKKYADIRKIIDTAAKKYSSDVRSKKFPKKENVY